jgi:hypothetical protein
MIRFLSSTAACLLIGIGLVFQAPAGILCGVGAGIFAVSPWASKQDAQAGHSIQTEAENNK